ncbi:glycosyltransferase [Butyrivibrio sp. FCS006]|uniref:glycosyltransferase n=1 Tax=Butyrivibrio sp. FCS006 TaxID=1280684 RepID=UPI00042A01C3|nr:glycosyltransferase [Butyrivibrio sp. FCS006]
MEKKHAYLIMAHNDFESLQYLLKAIDDKRNDIYLHIDKKTTYVDYEEIKGWVKKSGFFCVPRINVRWGHLSQVKCELLMLKMATSMSQYHYYHLLSGIDFPLKSQDQIHEYLDSQNKEFIEYHHCGDSGDDFTYKIKYYFPLMRWCGKGEFNGPGKKRALLRKMLEIQWELLEWQKRHGVDRTRKLASLEIVKGSNWFTITDDFARYLVAIRKRVFQKCRFTNGADEIFIGTVALNSRFKDRVCNNDLRKIDWNRGTPYEYTYEDLQELRASDCFFARKISYSREPELVKELMKDIGVGLEYISDANPLVSIVVPIYNVENFLEKCLTSIAGQSYRNIEVIMVDDGSKDNSADIAKKFAVNDDRFKYYHQENAGLSAARNTGINNATGEYISFIDSDDWIDSDFVKKLMEAIIAHNADLAVCGYYKEEDKIEAIGYDSEMILSRTAAMSVFEVIFPKEYSLMVIACNKLFKKSIFDNVKFKEGRIHEDEYTMHRIIDASSIVVTIPDVLYHYMIRANSITGANNIEDLRHFDIIDAHRDRVKCCRQQIYSDFYRLIVYSLFEEIICLMLTYDNETFDKYHLNKLFRRIMLKECIKHYNQLDRVQKKTYLAVIINPKLYTNHKRKIDATRHV